MSSITWEDGTRENREQNEGYLYVVEILDLGVKFGITTDPENRIRTHMSTAAAYGRETGRVWVSHPHTNYKKNERILKRIYKSKREYVRIPYEEVVKKASSLTKNFSERVQHRKFDSVVQEQLGDALNLPGASESLAEYSLVLFNMYASLLTKLTSEGYSRRALLQKSQGKTLTIHELHIWKAVAECTLKKMDAKEASAFLSKEFYPQTQEDTNTQHSPQQTRRTLHKTTHHHTPKETV